MHKIFLAGLVFTLLGCEGTIGWLPESDESPEAPTGEVLGERNTVGPPSDTAMQRLTAVEYENTLRDLFPGADVPLPTLPPDHVRGSFDTTALYQGVGDDLASRYVQSAETVGEWAADNLSLWLDCDVELEGRSCAERWLSDFGSRVHRRPLTEAQRAAYLRVYDAAALDVDGPLGGMQWMITALIQSPHFLYRGEESELLDGEEEEGGLRQIDGYARASRLSYFLWSSMPDAELLEAAATGVLDSAEGVEQHARRLLESERARPVVQRMFSQWLELDELSSLAKDDEAFPAYVDEVREDWKTETEMLVEHVVFDEGGSLAELFTTNTTFLNRRLGAVYGEDIESEEFVQVELDPDRRAGILTHGSFLALHAFSDHTSPIHRGAFVRQVIMCHELPPPPGSISAAAPEPDPTASTREKLDELTGGPGCFGCHELINPLGYAFERYDAVGRYREQDQYGHAIDDSGLLTGFADDSLAGVFNGPAELAHRFAESRQLHECFVDHLFRFGLGRSPEGEDHNTIIQIAETSMDGSIREALVAMTQSEEFLFHR